MSFIVAVGIFMAAFSVLVLFLSNIASESGSVTLADLESRSAAGLDVLLGGPGAPPNWGSSGDAANALSRMGLLEAGSNVRLDPGKLLRMANAPYAASPTDGHVSYEEAKRAMGLSGYDFHVRIRPAGSFDPLAELRNVSVAYIGDWREGQECLHVSSGAECRESLNESRSLTELAQTWGLRFRNATFFPNFTLAPTLAADKFRDSDFDETVMRTKQTYNLTLRLNGWETGGFDTTNLNALAHWRVEPRVSGRLVNGQSLDPAVGSWFATVSYWNATGGRYGYEDGNGTISVPTYTEVPNCDPISDQTTPGVHNCTYQVDQSPLPPLTVYGNWSNQTVPGPDITVPGARLTAARLVTPQINATAYDRILVSWRHFVNGTTNAATGGDYGRLQYELASAEHTWVEASDAFRAAGAFNAWEAASKEIDLTGMPAAERVLRLGFAWFGDNRNDNLSQGWMLDNVSVRGLVGTQAVPLWDNWNEWNRSRYNAVLIGTNVSHAKLNNETLKEALKAWVFAGGSLVGLGSTNTPGGSFDGWMSKLVQAGSLGSSSGLYEQQNDLQHPILTIPKSLGIRDFSAAANYRTSPQYYCMKTQQDADKFARILQQTGTADASCVPQTIITLWASNRNAFGNGTLVLTSYQPAHFGAATDIDDLHANFLLYNLLNVYTLDYGKSIPPDATVGASQRYALMPKFADPLRPRDLIEIEVTLYLWKTDRVSGIR